MPKKLFVLSALFVLGIMSSLHAQTPVSQIQLTDWELIVTNGADTSQSPIKAKVPGTGHTDLMKAGLAPDFFVGLNEKSALTQKLENSNWIYKTEFTIHPFDLHDRNVELVFEGIDTYSKVYLNDSLILETDNMFRTWKVNLTGKLLPTNQLTVILTSPLNYHRERVKNARYELPSGNETVPLKVAAYSRKACYHFGWDWGPRLVSCGIWRPCYINLWENFRMDDFYAQTVSITEDNASMRFEFMLESDSSYVDPFILETMGLEFQVQINKGLNKIVFFHHIPNPKLWYPNGYGEPYLYKRNIHLLDKAYNKVFTKEVEFAIRKIELVNEPDSIGTSFYFKVNNKPVFMKGANYIPQDMFLPRVTNEQTDQLLTMVKESGMNMLRVWGGGVYESDYFYQRCDELGILIWQDFMFANSLFPADKKFHETVLAEIADNVKRLRNHACIALWCGNNEIEVAWHNWGWQKQYKYSSIDSTLIWDNYQYLFHKLIPEVVKEHDPVRSSIPSSPQSNWGKAENFNHGAMHYWGVWHGEEPIENFNQNVGRFMVEYGFQSYPTMDLLNDYISSSQLNFESATFQNLQKSYKGNKLVLAEVARYFPELTKMSDWLWASQYAQGQALKEAIIAHRMNAPHCMGTLFWQLNDCWPGASWSVIDYSLTPKLSFLEVQKWYAPVIASFEKTKDSYHIKMVSDHEFEGYLQIRFLNADLGKLLYGKEIPVKLSALSAQKIWEIPVRKIRIKNTEQAVVEIEILDATRISVFQDRVTFGQLQIDEIY